MNKNRDCLLEYVYSESQYRRKLWWCFVIWLVLWLFRVTMHLTVGIAFLSSIPAVLSFYASGLVVGIAVHSIWRYRRSVRVDDVEAERARLFNK